VGNGKLTTLLGDLDYADDIALSQAGSKISMRSKAASIRSQGTPDSALTPPRKRCYERKLRLLKGFPLMDVNVKMSTSSSTARSHNP